MSEGTRVILRTMNGPPGKDGEVTLERLATELEPYAKQSDLLAEATRVDNLVQGQGTLLNLVNNGRLSPGGVATAARAATTRGTLPSGTDLNTLDTLGGADEAGAWLLSGSYTYGNQPPRTPGATAVLEVVVANAYTGIIQRVTESSGATWARNKVSTGAGAWTTWRRMDPHVDTTVGTRVFVGDVMIYGDTGWRDVRGMLPAGWTADAFAMRRVGPQVAVTVSGITPPDGIQGTQQIISGGALGDGWAPGDAVSVGRRRLIDEWALDVSWAGSLFVYVRQSGLSDVGLREVGWTVGRPQLWPTTLPGIPL